MFDWIFDSFWKSFCESVREYLVRTRNITKLNFFLIFILDNFQTRSATLFDIIREKFRVTEILMFIDLSVLNQKT